MTEIDGARAPRSRSPPSVSDYFHYRKGQGGGVAAGAGSRRRREAFAQRQARAVRLPLFVSASHGHLHGLTCLAAANGSTGETTLKAFYLYKRIMAEHNDVVPTCRCHKQQGGRKVNKQLYARKIRDIMTYHKIEEYKPGNTAF